MVAIWVVVAIGMAAWSHADGVLSWSGAIKMVGLSSAFVLGLSLILGVQRVEIDTAAGTIRFANGRTTQRWRIFRLRDVESIRWVESGGGKVHTNCLIMDLSPNIERKWNLVEFTNPAGTLPPKAPEVFLALVDAVRTAKPEVLVDLSGGWSWQASKQKPQRK